MKKTTLLCMLMRSLTIQASFNFRRMQNLGFAFTMVPLIAELAKDQREATAFLARHLQMFNTHPYLISPVVGSVARIEQAEPGSAAENLKKALMGPYAAIGDSFFWGALRSLSAVVAAALALLGNPVAPWAFIVLYAPAQVRVRVQGFFEGYRGGRNGIEFVRSLDLPGATARIRLLSMIPIGFLAALAVDATGAVFAFAPGVVAWGGGTALLLLFHAAMRRGLSQGKILYLTGLLCMAASVKVW